MHQDCYAYRGSVLPVNDNVRKALQPHASKSVALPVKWETGWSGLDGRDAPPKIGLETIGQVPTTRPFVVVERFVKISLDRSRVIRERGARRSETPSRTADGPCRSRTRHPDGSFPQESRRDLPGRAAVAGCPEACRQVADGAVREGGELPLRFPATCS